MDEFLPEQLEVKILYTECSCGICSYITAEGAEADYVPESIQEITGKVVNPENILSDGRYYTQFGDGERLTIEKLNKPQIVENNSIVLKMKKC